MMRRFFGPDSNLFKFLLMLMNLAIMNALFLLTSLPVITIGAAYTALLSCVFDLLMDEGRFSARFFLKKFRAVWKPASLIGTAGLLVLAVLAHHAALFFASESSVRLLITGLYIALFIWVFGTLFCQFALLARKERWEKEMLKDSALLALAKLPIHIAILILTLSPLTIVMMPASSVIALLPVVVLFWIACPAMASGWMLKRILEKIYPELFEKREEE